MLFFIRVALTMAFHHRNRIEMKKQTIARRKTKKDRVQRSSNNQECIFLVGTSVFQLLWVGEIVWVYVSIRKSEQKLEIILIAKKNPLSDHMRDSVLWHMPLWTQTRWDCEAFIVRNWNGFLHILIGKISVDE